jgi:hypothetical protein
MLGAPHVWLPVVQAVIALKDWVGHVRFRRYTWGYFNLFSSLPFGHLLLQVVDEVLRAHLSSSPDLSGTSAWWPNRLISSRRSLPSSVLSCHARCRSHFVDELRGLSLGQIFVEPLWDARLLA